LGESILDISAKFCPVCKNKNDREAIICVHCGASLETYATDSAATRTTDGQTTITEKIGELFLEEAMIPAKGIAFYVESTPKPIFSSSDEEFVIGRKVDGKETSGVFLDLSGFGGYHLGLSRRHAMIRRTKLGYDVIDLSSSNGTWLNDERLIPNVPYPLISGSELRLARMRLFLLYRSIPQTKKKV
jgi:pSer/pThr/pTyr-binding forkhead associated (FHA) protein